MQDFSNLPQSNHASNLLLGGRSLAYYCDVFRSVFDQSTDNVIITDELGQFVYINPVFSKTIALAADKVHGLTGPQLVPDSDAMKQHFNLLLAVISTRQPKSVLIVKPDNFPLRSINDDITISPIFDDHQNVIGTVSIGRENSQESYLQDEEIKFREHYLRALLDNFPFMVWLKDINNNFLAANAMFAQVAGLSSAKELEGKSDFDFFPEHMAKGYVADDIEVLKSGKPKTLIEEIKRSDEETFWAETYKSPVCINDKVIGTVGFARDISVRKKLLSEIARRETDYSSLVQSLPLAIIRYDLNLQCVFVNTYWSVMHKECGMSVIGKTPMETWNACVQNITSDQFAMRLREVIAHQSTQTFEIEYAYDDKTSVFALKMVPEFDEDQKVAGILMLASDITEISQYRQRLEHLAYHDPLTDLPNRTLFNDRLNFAIGHAQRFEQQFGVLLIDLDNFKSVNDTMGHAVGDTLLKEASKRLLSCVRNYDTVARMGGDEFAILITDIKTMQDLAAMAAKIGQLMATPFILGGSEFFITASIGISRYPHDSKNMDDLVKYADSAMYYAKHKGRNNYQFYAHELTLNATERLSIENKLRYALEKSELEIYYQPSVYLSADKAVNSKQVNRIIGAEALLRWNNSDIGNIGPSKFIPVAEDTGMIVHIGAWVLMNVFTTVVALNTGRQEPLVISVNISSRQFVQNNILAFIEHALRVSNCRPEWIVLEITESLLLQDDPAILATLSGLHALGLGISIDDFGTGYSALGYLNKFPVSQVKIDRSFVRDIKTDKEAGILVQAIISMAKTLNKELIAEGIETSEQAELLQSWGCILAQGYLFGKPLPLKEFQALLAVSDGNANDTLTNAD